MAQENIDELHRRVKELESKVAYLNAQLKQDNRFGLQWIDVPEAFDAESENKIPILEEVPELAITNDDGKPTHILIEGDNYHALTCLNYTHHGKVDVIYIDPPYNIGDGDFIYNDARFINEYPDGVSIPTNHPLRHSAWLSFMEKRLLLAKKLLSDEGIIFISIDDNELANLKALCDKVFDYNNFLGHIVWESTTQPINAGTAKYQLQQKTETIFCYCKNKNKKAIFKLKVDDDVSPKYPHHGIWGRCRFEVIEKSDAGGYKRDTMKFPILGQYPREGKRWQIGEDKARQLEREQKVEIVDGMVKIAIYPEDEIDSISYKPFWSLLLAKDFGTALSAKKELNNIMGRACGFDTVKPMNLIIELISHFKNDAIVLDFFAGSGTTMHSILKMNNKDNGRRVCISVQNSEKNICRDLTYERYKKAINGYKLVEPERAILYKKELNVRNIKHSNTYLEEAEEIKRNEANNYDELKIKIEENTIILEGKRNSMASIPPLGNSLKYYRTSFVGSNASSQATDEDKTILAQKAGCLLALAENTLYEQKTTDNYQLFKDKDKDVWTAVYFKEDYRPKFFNEFVDGVKELKGTKNVYIFSWGDVGSFEPYFEDDSHVQIKGIPQPILDIYKSLNS